MIKGTDHSYKPGTFSLGVPEGIVGREATQGENVATYGCNHCLQYTEDPLAHEEIFHPEVVQERNLKSLKPRGIVTRVLAPVALILGTSLLGGCEHNKEYTLENQPLQGWYSSTKDPDSPAVLVFDSLPKAERGDRKPNHQFIYNGNPINDSLKVGRKYNLVVSDTLDNGIVYTLKPSK